MKKYEKKSKRNAILLNYAPLPVLGAEVRLRLLLRLLRHVIARDLRLT